MKKRRIIIFCIILYIFVVSFKGIQAETFVTVANNWSNRVLILNSLQNGSYYNETVGNVRYTVTGTAIGNNETVIASVIPNSTNTSVKIYDKLSYAATGIRTQICHVINISSIGGNITTMQIDPDYINRFFQNASNNNLALTDYSSKAALSSAAQTEYDGVVNSNPSSAAAIIKDNNTIYLWKTSTYDSTNNKAITNINTCQIINKPKIDFIFAIDNSLSYSNTASITADSRTYSANYPQIVRMYLYKYLEQIFSSPTTYDNQVAFVTYTNNNSQTQNFGFYNTEASAKSGVESTYLGATPPAATNYAYGLEEAKVMAQSSRQAGRVPVVIFMASRAPSDSSATVTAAADGLKEYANIYSVSLFNANLGNTVLKTISSDNAVHTFNNTASFGNDLTDIIKNEIGYNIKTGTKINDEIYATLSGLSNITLTPQSGTTAALSNNVVTWNIDGGNTRIESGTLLTCEVDVPLAANTVYSGSIPTNGNCIVVDSNNNEIGRLAAANSPVLGKDLTIKLIDENNNPVPNAQFKLYVDGVEENTYTTNSNGVFIIPYSNVKMNLTETCELRQITTANTLRLPEGTWNLNVNSGYTITSTTSVTAGDQYTENLQIDDGMFVAQNKLIKYISFTDTGQSPQNSAVTIPLQNAELVLSTDFTFTDNTQTVSIQTTDANGNVEFESPKAGTYYLKQNNLQNDYYEDIGYWTVVVDRNQQVDSITELNRTASNITGHASNYTITNLLKGAEQLILTSAVAGDYDETPRTFTFNIKIKDENNNLIEDVRLEKLENSQTINFSNNSNVTLGNRQSITLCSLRNGWKYEITEVGQTDNRYTLAYEVNNDSQNMVNNTSVTETIGKNNQIKAIHTRNLIPITGILNWDDSSGIYMVVFSIIGCILILLFFVIKKKMLKVNPQKRKSKGKH